MNFDETRTTRYLEIYGKSDPNNMTLDLIKNDNFDNDTSYGKTNEIFNLVNNKEFSPGVGILNIDNSGSFSLFVDWKIHATKSKHSYFALQINQHHTSKIVKLTNEDKPNQVIMELLKPDTFFLLKEYDEIEELLLAKKAEGDTHSDITFGTIAIPANWCHLVNGSNGNQDLAVLLLKDASHYVRCNAKMAKSDWIKRLINFAQLLYMMPDLVASIDTIGLKYEDIDPDKKVHGGARIKEIAAEFELKSKPFVDVREVDRLPICTECSAYDHSTENCPLLTTKEDIKNEDVESTNSITDLLHAPIPKKQKLQKEMNIESSDDEESTDCITLAEANFTSVREKYKSKIASENNNFDNQTQMAHLLASIMKTDKNVFAKTSALGIESLESITIDLNGNGGNKVNAKLLKILMETSDKDDIPKFFNSELKKSIGEDDDPISNLDKNTTRLIMKGHLIGDSTIRDPKEAEGVSIFALVPLGETASSKSASGQNTFIPSTSEQFLEMLRSFKILLRFIGGKKSAIAVQSKKLHANFKKVKINLKEFFMANGENGGQYLCLIIYNLTFNMLSDITGNIVPSTDHLQMDHLITQLQIGMAIPISSTKSPAIPASSGGGGGGGRRNNDESWKKRKLDNLNNQTTNSPTVGEYIFEDGKEYGKFFSGRALAKHQPACPKIKGKHICIGYLVNGKCNNERCKNFHGSSKSAKENVTKWISGNSLPLKIRE